MIPKDASQDTRRRFFLKAACLSSVSSATRHLTAQEPFDSLPASVWQNARRNGLIMIHRPTPGHLSSRTQIAANDEPGDRLIVAGQVFAPDGLSPASGVTVYAYNTDAEGYYGENKKEYPPRIYGWMETNAAGRFELRTIRPGSYPGMQSQPTSTLSCGEVVILFSGPINWNLKATGISHQMRWRRMHYAAILIRSSGCIVQNMTCFSAVSRLDYSARRLFVSCHRQACRTSCRFAASLIPSVARRGRTPNPA